MMRPRRRGLVLLFAVCIAPGGALKVLLFGANGNLGSRVLYQLAACGHEVTCFDRSEQRLRAGFNSKIFDDVTVIEGDACDRAAVDAAMSGATYDAMVSTAGCVDNAVRSEEEARSTSFCRMFANIAGSAEQHGPRRAIFIGGITALDVPGTPPQPLQPLLQRRSPQYVAHLLNLEVLKRSELDWTLLCPGYLVDAAPTGCDPAGCVPEDKPLRLSTNILPTFSPDRAFKPWQLRGPFKYPFVLLPFLRRKAEWTVPYESAAAVLVDNLEPGRFSRDRIGLANPPGVKLKKLEAARKKERKARAERNV